MDLSRTLQLHTVRLEISEATLAELRGAKAEAATQVLTPPPAAVPSLQSGDTLRIEVPRVQTLAFEAPRHLIPRPVAGELSDTLYDGGALRKRAVQLATVQESDGAAAFVAQYAASARTPATNKLLRRPLAAFRKSSWVKQLTIALLPLALAGVWAMHDGSASTSSPHVAASIRSPAPSLSPAPSPAPARSAGAPTSAASAPSPSPAATVSKSAPPSTEHAQLEAASRPSDPSERMALIAAFSGNKAEAAALYDRLATSRNSRTFALAARLTREDRVRKP